ncbi:MAG: hypothetical protein Q8R26_01350 [bacterium]|nr:hypothetical protein [bacterium]
MNSIPERVVKNAHIPGLGLEIIMTEGGKYAKKDNIDDNGNYEYISCLMSVH